MTSSQVIPSGTTTDFCPWEVSTTYDVPEKHAREIIDKIIQIKNFFIRVLPQRSGRISFRSAFLDA